MFGANQQIKCGLTLYVLLCISTTSARHHSGQNVVDTEGLFTSERITVRRGKGVYRVILYSLVLFTCEVRLRQDKDNPIYLAMLPF